MNADLERRYCQSCGMPLNLTLIEYLGTNADRTPSHEYCYYCLKDGEYTVDYTSGQMVDIWVKYADKYNGYADTDYTPEELRAILAKRMPTLNRWKQKEETENVHCEIVNRIQVYINQHLFSPLETEELSQIAGLSVYHFRRVFKEITGENIGSYIQRLRLEYIAYKLISTSLSVADIIRQTSIYNKHSLAKAFRKHFGLSITEYRKRRKIDGLADASSVIGNQLHYRMVRLSDLHVLYLQVGDAYTNLKKYQSLWKRLINYADEQNLSVTPAKYISISHDEPLVTKTEQCRFYVGITLTQPVKPAGPFGVMQVPDGLYAVFSYKGSPVMLPDLYRDIYQNWLPANNYRQRDPLTFEMYMNTPREVPFAELMTDIYIPVEKIKD